MNEHVKTIADDDLSALPIVEQIILMSKTNYGRYPMLEELFDQFQAFLTLAMDDYTSTKTEVTLTSLDYVSYGGILEEYSNPSLFGLAQANPWDGVLAVVAEPALIFTILQTMLGGRPSSGTQTKRKFTGLEKRIGAKFYDAVLSALANKLSEVTPVSFQFDRIEEDPEELELAPLESACVKVVMNILLEGQGGKITFIIPYIAFEAASTAFSQPFRGGDIGGMDSWRSAMSQSLQTTDVRLTVILKEMTAPLHEILSWQQGQVLDIGVDTEHEVLVMCSERQMFHAEMGCRKNGSVALKISETLTEMNG